jgi:hypothetical protein
MWELTFLPALSTNSIELYDPIIKITPSSTVDNAGDNVDPASVKMVSL